MAFDDWPEWLDAAEPASLVSRRMGMRRRCRPMAEGVRLALATGVFCLLTAACEPSPGSTSNQDRQGRTVTAAPSTSPRPDASTTAGASDIRLIDEADADLVLYVSNQSFAESPVSIQIAIDGVLLVDQAFAIEGGHNWFTFPVSIPPGQHVLTATSGTGASIEQAIEIPQSGRRWAALDYWYSPGGEPRRFTWYISSEPIVFA